MCSLGGLVSIVLISLFINLNLGVSCATAELFKQRPSDERYQDFGGNQDDDGVGNSLLQIEIIRKPVIGLNGTKVTERNLLEHLEEHERELIFGKSREKRSLKLVHLRHHPDANLRSSADASAAATANSDDDDDEDEIDDGNAEPDDRKKRRKRSTDRQTGAQATRENVLHIRDAEELLQLSLKQSPKLIDESFVFIRSYDNSSELIGDSHQIAKKFANCFYSSENAALDLWDKGSVRGVFHHNNKDYVIHPLPERFGNTSHVIFERNYRSSFGRSLDVEDPFQIKILNENVQFEPNKEGFNEPHNRRIGIEESLRASKEKPLKSHKQHHQHQNQHPYQHQRYQHQSHKHLNLNLRYKPRYHHPHSHQMDQQFEFKHYLRQQERQQERRPYKRLLKKHSNSRKSDVTPKPRQRHRRYIASGNDHWDIPKDLHIETAIFVDSDLIKHMAKNFPSDTENQLIRFVLAMINGVQILYHHPTLGKRVNFVLKRLQIMVNDPEHLRRSNDIDTYLSSFCVWQQKFNPLSDAVATHYDHAVILTGLDLYVVDKNGKVTSQVVGLAPVAGMCTETSSCTINEAKHFESVFVVAHEIGHNLGMRHDTNENSCDPSLFIMSPTLGSGKTTWSKCSRTYLNSFLETRQAQCLFDRGQFVNHLDHSAEGSLPGERFDANQQCMLKYGKDSVRSQNQTLPDICRDLHCKKGTYTWNSHPALEGTECGINKYCSSGTCITRPSKSGAYSPPNQTNYASKSDYEKKQFLGNNKMGHLMQEPSWSVWSEASNCDSGCLYGPNKRLIEGSTGLKVYRRSCTAFNRTCLGRDRKFETCIAKTCYNVTVTTIEQFATSKCEQAQKSDTDLTGQGLQIDGDIEESCKVFCKTKANGIKSRRWFFPDGTTCRSKYYNAKDISYCIAGRCEKFSCDNSTSNFYQMDPRFCQSPKTQKPISNEIEIRPNTFNNNVPAKSRIVENDQQYQSNNQRGVGVISGPTTIRSKYENEVSIRSFQRDYPYKKPDNYRYRNKYSYPYSEPRMPSKSASLVSLSPSESEWVVQSGCHASCMMNSKGIQVVTSRRTGKRNIQLCSPSIKPCERILTTTEFAENTCARYKLKVRGLSGYGSQIAASIEEPDRSCRVGCQDEFIKYRYYLVNGKYGHFPIGTRCSAIEDRYCVNGKCLEFGKDQIPLQESHVSLALFRSKREAAESSGSHPVALVTRKKRSFLYYDPVNITQTITQEFIDNIVNSIITLENATVQDEPPSPEHIEFHNPIHISMDDVGQK